MSLWSFKAARDEFYQLLEKTFSETTDDAFCQDTVATLELQLTVPNNNESNTKTTSPKRNQRAIPQAFVGSGVARGQTISYGESIDIAPTAFSP